MGNACPFAADKEEQQQLCRAEWLAGEARWLQVCWVDANAKLFVKLTRKRMIRQFTILHLSAGKLPQARHGTDHGKNPVRNLARQ